MFEPIMPKCYIQHRHVVKKTTTTFDDIISFVYQHNTWLHKYNKSANKWQNKSKLNCATT